MSLTFFANLQVTRGVVAAGNPIDVEEVVEHVAALTAGTPFALPDAVVTGPKGWGHGIILARQPTGGLQQATFTDDVNWLSLTGGVAQRVYSVNTPQNQGDGIAACVSVRSRAVPGAAGSFPGCTGVLSRDVPAAPAGRWLGITRFLKPANPAVAASYVGRQSNGLVTADTTTLTWTFNSQAGDNMAVDLDILDTSGDAVITLPALAPGENEWVERSRRVWSGGTFVTLMKRVVDPTIKSYTFGIGAPATVAPVNTVAPTVSGSPVAGATLTCLVGSWTGAPTGYTFQWRANGVDIPGAISSTYPTNSGDDGKTFTCVVVASNGVGPSAPAASSNSVVIPARPSIITAPAITPAGPYHTGDVVTCDGGTWTGGALTYQWFRGASPLTGQTFPGYQLDQTDENAQIFCRVTASNGGGTASADSNHIVPLITSPLSDASGLFYYSGGPGNTDPSLCLGGARGGTIQQDTLGSLIETIIGSVAQAGGDYYVDIYARNTHGAATDPATRLFVPQQPTNTAGAPVPSVTVRAAVPVQAAGADLPVRASLTTPPPGVVFTSAADFASGDPYGDLGPGQARGIHLHFHVAPGAPRVDDGAFFEIAVDSETA